MKTYYKKDLKRSYLILEGTEGEQEDYQIAMLKGNQIPGILETDVRYIDNRSHYYYDISGKISLASLYEKRHLSMEDMKQLVCSLLHTLRALQKYMLESNSILLEPEYIFCREESVFFCYYPSCEKESGEAFHELTEFFIRQVDGKDEEGVHLAYTLHKATMEDNYSIEQIVEELLPCEEKEPEGKAEPVVVDYAKQMEAQELEEMMVAEKPDFWEPVKRLLERKWNNLRRDGEEDL